MKIEVEIISMEHGYPTVLEYEGVLYYMYRQDMEKPKHESTGFHNPYRFRRD